MAKSPTLEQAFEPVRTGLKRTLVESEQRELRETALRYLDATDELVEMSKPGGALTRSHRSELLARVKEHGVSVARSALANNWPLVLRIVYQALSPPPGDLADPPGGPDTFPPKPRPLPVRRDRPYIFPTIPPPPPEAQPETQAKLGPRRPLRTK